MEPYTSGLINMITHWTIAYRNLELRPIRCPHLGHQTYLVPLSCVNHSKFGSRACNNVYSQNYLPGLESLDRSVYFINVTYPRFLSIPRTTDRSSTTDADLLLELRVGRSGLGDDWLYQYVPGSGWKQIGRYLEVSVVTYYLISRQIKSVLGCQ